MTSSTGGNDMAPSLAKSPPPPPTPHLARKPLSKTPTQSTPKTESLETESDADRIIRENENLLELFPPLPKSVMEEK